MENAVELGEMPELWIVGKKLEESTNAWEFQGVFDSLERAVKACQHEMYFVAPANLNEELPDDSLGWPGTYYPHLEENNMGN